RLAVRPPGGLFGAEVNVSQSPGLLSDDLALALEPDGTLDLVWVDQNHFDVTTFDVTYATRAPSGTLSPPDYFGAQGLWAAVPSVAPGLIAAWRTGVARGPLWLATAQKPPQPIASTTEAGQVALARGPGGELHLAFTDGMPSTVKYAWMR